MHNLWSFCQQAWQLHSWLHQNMTFCIFFAAVNKGKGKVFHQTSRVVGTVHCPWKPTGGRSPGTSTRIPWHCNNPGQLSHAHCVGCNFPRHIRSLLTSATSETETVAILLGHVAQVCILGSQSMSHLHICMCVYWESMPLSALDLPLPERIWLLPQISDWRSQVHQLTSLLAVCCEAMEKYHEQAWEPWKGGGYYLPTEFSLL